METFAHSLCKGNPPGTAWFSSQTPVTWSFDVFFDLRLDKRLNKQSRRLWFETPLCPLWRHCNRFLSFSGDSSGEDEPKTEDAPSYQGYESAMYGQGKTRTLRGLNGDVMTLKQFQHQDSRLQKLSFNEYTQGVTKHHRSNNLTIV